jgi:hypothetical protein
MLEKGGREPNGSWGRNGKRRCGKHWRKEIKNVQNQKHNRKARIRLMG